MEFDQHKAHLEQAFLNRNTWIAACSRDDGKARIASLDVDGIAEFDLASIACWWHW